MGKLVAGQNRTHDFAHPYHVAVHATGVARGAGDGDAERKTCVRSASHGVELLQSRLHHRWSGDRLLARSAFRCALTRGSGYRHAHRRRVAIDRTISIAVEGRLQISPRSSLARRRCAHGADVDGTCGRRGERSAGERFDQQRIRRGPWERTGELAQHCVSADAIAAGNFRRRHRHRYLAVGIKARCAREHRRVPRDSCARNAAGLFAHDSVGDRTRHAGVADH